MSHPSVKLSELVEALELDVRRVESPFAVAGLIETRLAHLPRHNQ
jgi:hypothetical protein